MAAAQELPLAAATFDNIVLFDVLHHRYTNASPFAQQVGQKVYIGGCAAARRLTGRGGFRDLVDNNRSARGMDFYRDVQAWWIPLRGGAGALDRGKDGGDGL